MPFVKRRGREAADLWATVPVWCPSAGEADEREPTARKPAAPCAPGGILQKSQRAYRGGRAVTPPVGICRRGVR